MNNIPLVGSPPILDRESTELGVTLYTKIDLNITETSPETAVFIPTTLDATNGINLVIYLRGHKWQDGIVSIKEYLSAPMAIFAKVCFLAAAMSFSSHRH